MMGNNGPNCTPIFNTSMLLDSGLIFSGLNQLVENVFADADSPVKTAIHQ